MRRSASKRLQFPLTHGLQRRQPRGHLSSMSPAARWVYEELGLAEQRRLAIFGTIQSVTLGEGSELPPVEQQFHVFKRISDKGRYGQFATQDKPEVVFARAPEAVGWYNANNPAQLFASDDGLVPLGKSTVLMPKKMAEDAYRFSTAKGNTLETAMIQQMVRDLATASPSEALAIVAPARNILLPRARALALAVERRVGQNHPLPFN